jgi:hypothetical protein
MFKNFLTTEGIYLDDATRAPKDDSQAARFRAMASLYLTGMDMGVRSIAVQRAAYKPKEFV